MRLNMVNLVCVSNHGDVWRRSTPAVLLQVPIDYQPITVACEHLLISKGKAEDLIINFTVLGLERGLIQRVVRTIVFQLACGLFELVEVILSGLRDVNR